MTANGKRTILLSLILCFSAHRYSFFCGLPRILEGDLVELLVGRRESGSRYRGWQGCCVEHSGVAPVSLMAQSMCNSQAPAAYGFPTAVEQYCVIRPYSKRSRLLQPGGQLNRKVDPRCTSFTQLVAKALCTLSRHNHPVLNSLKPPILGDLGDNVEHDISTVSDFRRDLCRTADLDAGERDGLSLVVGDVARKVSRLILGDRRKSPTCCGAP